jgi:hypothetical protein
MRPNDVQHACCNYQLLSTPSLPLLRLYTHRSTICMCVETQTNIRWRTYLVSSMQAPGELWQVLAPIHILLLLTSPHAVHGMPLHTLSIIYKLYWTQLSCILVLCWGVLALEGQAFA